MPTPTIVAVDETSITLQWNEPPPELAGNPHRNITQYAVTIIPQDGGESQVVFVRAEEDTFYNVTSLHLATIYDIKVHVVIDTERQGEQTYDIGPPVFSVTTTRAYNNELI